MKVLSFQDVGPPATPQEIRRFRQQALGSLRHLGSPVVWRHAYDLQDVDSGEAKQCPACFNTTYGQSRQDCPVCYGTTFVSAEDNPLPLWIDSDGLIIETSGSQPAGTVRAPRYGGFAIPYLTWVIQPDIAVDVFRLNEQGALVQQYDATCIAPWFPTMGDNDLMINVQIGLNNSDIIQTLDRFTLKHVQQITARGLGRASNRLAQANGQPYLIQQSFEMNKIPSGHILLSVPSDEEWYGEN